MPMIVPETDLPNVRKAIIVAQSSVFYEIQKDL